MSSTRWRVLFGVLLAVALAAGIGIGAIAFGGGGDGDPDPTADGTDVDEKDDEGSTSSTTTTDADDPEHPAPPSQTVPEDGLEGDALAFAVALNQVRDLRYYARYEGSGETAEGTPSKMVVEVWRAAPLARRDFTISEGDFLVSREYLVGGRVTGCFGLDADNPDDLACMDATASGTDPASPAFEAIDPRSGDVTATEETVDGQVVQCFHMAATEGPREVCFDGAGIPVVVDDGDIRFVRTVVSDQVTDSDFVPPGT